MLVALNLPNHALCGCLRSEIRRVPAQTVLPAVHRQLSPRNVVARVSEMNVNAFVRQPSSRLSMISLPVHDSLCLSTILACPRFLVHDS